MLLFFLFLAICVICFGVPDNFQPCPICSLMGHSCGKPLKYGINLCASPCEDSARKIS